jgi:hypothetical protein
MDFIVGLPTMQSGYDSIWFIVSHFSKVAHFIPVKTTYKGSKLAELYIARIVCLHGVPKKIVSNRGTQFTSRFWEKLHEVMDSKLNFSSVYHPQTDGQTEMVRLGIRVSRMQSSPIIIVIRKVWRCHHLKCYMDESAELLSLEWTRRKSSFWTRNSSRSIKTSSSHKSELEASPIKEEKLCGL